MFIDTLNEKISEYEKIMKEHPEHKEIYKLFWANLVLLRLEFLKGD